MAEARSAAIMRVALAQMCSSRDIAENIETASALIREAAGRGAVYVQTPEVTTLVEMKRADLLDKAEPFEGNHAVAAFSQLAGDLGIWLHIGSMVVKLSDEKVANRAVVFRPDGSLAATYDKIHMFDVELPSGERYRESKNYQPGDQAPLIDTPLGRLGVTICYDMRFAPLYAAMAQAGADVLTMPSAFTVPTGEAHWHTLLRARAIETQCFVLAAAQVGAHDCGRKTYGHSIAVSPWGEVIAEGDGQTVGVVMADLDLGHLSQARQRIPARTHVVPFRVVPPAEQA